MAIINAFSVDPTPLPISGTVSTTELNQAAFRVETLTVVTAGTPVQGAAVPVPNSVATSILNPSTNAPNALIYVANSGANTALAANRLELKRGESVALFLTNTNLIFVDSSVNGQVAKLIVEA